MPPFNNQGHNIEQTPGIPTCGGLNHTGVTVCDWILHLIAAKPTWTGADPALNKDKGEFPLLDIRDPVQHVQLLNLYLLLWVYC